MDIFLEERQIQWMGPKVMLPDDRGMEFQKSAAGSGEPLCEDAIWEKTWRKGEYDLSLSEGRKLRQKKHLVIPGLGRNVPGCPGKAQRLAQQKWRWPEAGQGGNRGQLVQGLCSHCKDS